MGKLSLIQKLCFSKLLILWVYCSFLWLLKVERYSCFFGNFALINCARKRFDCCWKVSFFGVAGSLIPQAISLQHVWDLMNILLADSVWLAQVYRRMCAFSGFALINCVRKRFDCCWKVSFFGVTGSLIPQANSLQLVWDLIDNNDCWK